MGETNQTQIQKADLQVQDLVNEGGFLNAEQSKEFFEIAIEESVLLGIITVKPMSSNSFELSKMGFTGRILRGATESTALSVGERSRPTLGRVTLQTVEFIAEVHIPYAAVEDNVAQDTLVPFVIGLMGSALSRDIEEIAIQGDTASADPVLALMDGFLKQAVSQVVAVGQVRLTKSIFKQMAQTMPTPFFKNRRTMAFFTSKNAAIDYSDSLSSRSTPLGDKHTVENATAEWGGIPVVDIPMFPEDQGGGTNETSMLLSDIKNFTVGIQREIRIESKRDIQARDFIIVATVRFDVKFAHEPAVVKATEILASAGP